MTSRSAATSSRMLRRYSSTAAVGLAAGRPRSPGQRPGSRRAARRRAAASSAPTHRWRSRTRWPLTDQPGTGAGRRPEVEHARPLVEEQRGSTGTPAVASAGDGQQQAADAVLARRVTGDGRVRAVAQDLADQLGQHPARAGLDEDPGARRVHAPRSGRRSAPGWPPARPAGPGWRPARRGRGRPWCSTTREPGQAPRRRESSTLGEQRWRPPRRAGCGRRTTRRCAWR